MSELSYKELQEQGVFDVPYRAFYFMQEQQAKINELQAMVDAIHDIIKKAKKSKSGNYLINEIDTVIEGNKNEN